MAGPKSIQTRVVGIITDEMHPYIQFSSNRVSMKMCRDYLICYYPYYSCLCTFCPTIPTYSSLFILVCVHFFSSIATVFKECGLVHSLFGTQLCNKINSRAFVLHSFLRA